MAANKSKAEGQSGTSKPGKSADNSDALSKSQPASEIVDSGLIADRFGAPGDWRPKTLDGVRRLIQEAAPDIIEERKWAKASNPEGVPVWSQAGIVCTGEIYKSVVKLTFARGASLEDPHGLFNSSLEGKTRRAIDIREGETLNAEAFKALIQAAIAENLRRNAP